MFNLNNITHLIDTHPIGRIFQLGQKKAVWKRVEDLNAGMRIAVTKDDNHGVYFDEIVSIKKVGRERVYDIEVEGTHNFVGNGIIAHNTIITGDVGIGTTAPTTALHVGTSAETHALSTGDALISSDLELDGVLYLDGGTISNSAGTASLVLSSAPTTTANTLSASNWLIENTANVGQAALIINQTKAGELLTASASGVTKFTIANTGAITSAIGNWTSQVADSSTAVGFTFNTSNTLSTQGSKLLSFQNLGTEKMYLDKDGNLYVAGTLLSGNGTSMLLTNKSGGVVANRALVILDSSNNSSFTTTTTPYNKAGFGVVVGVGLGVTNDADGDGACDANDICMVAYGGEVEVTVKNASTAVKGDYLFTSDTAGSAVASAKQYDGLVGAVSNIAGAGSGYVKMIFKVQPQVTAAAAIDKTTKHNEYWLYADNYKAVGEGANTDTNLLVRGLTFDNFTDTTKVDSTNTTASLDTNTQRTGLIGGQTMATSTTDNDGQTYLGSNTVNDQYYYDRTRDSSPQVQVELGLDPNWYNGVTLSVATTSAQFSQNSVITQKNPNLSTTYNGSLIKVTGTDSTPRTIYITIKSPTTFDWTNYNGQAATGVTITSGTAQALGTTGVSATFTNARYNTGDVFKIASWFIEAESATRGAKQQFPERSNVIATASSVDIIDADTQKLWMRFSQGTNYAIGVDANNDPSSANMLNGKAYISTNGSAATGLYTLDFAHDAVFKQNATDYRLSDTALYGRNGTNTYNVINTSNILVNITANDVSAAVIPNQPTQEVTVSGWGYIVGNGTTTATETVNLPYKFNGNPIINATSARNTTTTAPTSLSDCTGASNSVNASAYSITSNNFTLALNDTDGTALTLNTRFYCYTWTATGQVSPKQFVAVGTNGGVTVINETNQTAINGTNTSQTNVVFLTSKGDLYHSHGTTNNWLGAFHGIAGQTANGFSYHEWYGDTVWSANNIIHLIGNNSLINSLSVTEGTSTIGNEKGNTLYIGSAAGVSVVQEDSTNLWWNEVNLDTILGSSKYYTKDYISEEMVGDIRGMWPMQDTNGDNYHEDVSVKANHLIGNNVTAADIVSGVRNNAYDFDGSTENIYCTDAACGGTSKLDITGSNSVGAWIKRSSTGTDDYVFAKCTASTCNNQFYIGSDNKVYFRWYTSAAWQGVTGGSSRTIDTNWHYIVGTYDGSNAKVYIDGVLDTSTAETTSGTDDAGDFNIGVNNNGAANGYFGGYIDEPFVTATALTAGQIKNMYQVGYRALQSHATTLGGGAADTNQQLGFISTGTNIIGDARPDWNNQFMYVGTNSTTLGAVSKIDLNSDTNIKTYNSSANVPTGGPLLIDEDTKSLAVGYNLEAVGSAASGVKTMGVDNNATATSGNFIGKTITTAESFNQAYLWAQYTLDASDASNTIQVWASNDGGSNYYQCNLTNTDTSRSPSEYEYFCQFNTAGSSLKTKFVMARGSTKTNTWVSKYGIAWIDSNAIAGSANGSGLFTNTNASVANGSYIDVAHNQNSNDVVTNGWVYDGAKWIEIDDSTGSINTADPSLTAWWKAEEASGGLDNAEGTAANDLVASGSATYQQTGEKDYAISLDGTDDRFVSALGADNNNFDFGTGSFSIGGWFKHNTIATNPDYIITKYSPLSSVDSGSGTDGAVTISTDTSINTANSISGRSCSDGGDAVNYSVSSLTSTTATLESTISSGCLATGDEVLLINLRGTSSANGNVGNYETLRISSVSGSNVNFVAAKTKYYGDGASDDSNIGLATTNQTVMLQRVPNYTNVTIQTAGTDFYPDEYVKPTGSANNGAGEGGIIFFRATGAVTINSGTTINANGKGYIGGTATSGYGGGGGEAFCGTGGAGGTSGHDNGYDGAAGGGGNYAGGSVGGNGSCGGGGSGYGTGGTGSATKGGSGGGGVSGGGNGNAGAGGGGGYGSAGAGGSNGGGNGGTNTSGNGAGGTYYGGAGGGGTYGDADLTRLMFGSSGGGGAFGSGTNPNGGDGGGIISINSNSITVSGGVQSNGTNGVSPTSGGGGGGGAGGSIRLSGDTVSLGSSVVVASGGSGGVAQLTGGAGGTGRIAVNYATTITGTTSPTYTGAQVAANSGGYKLYMNASGNYVFGVDDDPTSFPEDSATTETNYADNAWHHVVAVKNGTSNIKLYVDGQELASDYSLSTTSSISNSNPFFLGADYDGTSNPWAGLFDEVFVYGRALSAGEVEEIYQSNSKYQIVQTDANTARLYNYSGATQNLRLDVITGGLGRNAGTVSLAPAAADVDSAASTNSIWINKTGSGGNLLKLQTSGTDVLSLTGAGLMTLTGNFVPGTDDTYDLGTNTARWRDIYLGPATAHIGTSTTDEGTISYDTTNNIFQFGTDATTNADIAFFTDDLYLDKSTGNVGIGTTAPFTNLQVVGRMNIGTTVQSSFAHANSKLQILSNGAQEASIGFWQSGQASALIGHAASSSNFYITNTYAGDAIGTAAKSITLDSSGNVGIGTTGPGTKFSVVQNVQSAFGSSINNLNTVDDGGTYTLRVGTGAVASSTSFNLIGFVAGATSDINGSIVGTIRMNNNAVAYNTTSDQRLKTNIAETHFTLDDLNKIKVVDFNFINDPNSSLRTGMLAQQLYNVYPEAVSVGGDDPNKNPWGIDYGRLTPLIVKSIQEQQGQIASLSGQLANLTLTDTGDLNISQDNSGNYVVEKTESTFVKTTVDRIGAYAQLVSANIRAGLIESKVIKTELISPVADADLIIDLSASESARLVIKGENDQEVASIDATGTATFAGQVNSEQLTVNSDATVSGTLYADKIESTRLSEIEELLREVETNQLLLTEAANWNINTATASADLTATNLFVTGQAAITSLFVSDNFTTKNINSLTEPLSIQSLASAPLEIMAGKIIIDTNGNATFEGDVEIAGNLKINNIIVANNIDPIATESASLIEGEITTNATAGKAVLTANTEKIRINNNKVSLNTLIYITPITSTQNKVLYVKAKDEGFFDIGFSDTLDTDVEFNWWIIELEENLDVTN